VNRKILALNFALLAMLGMLGWMLRAHWRETRAQELATLAKPPRGSAQVPPPSPRPPEAVVPANYLEVAQKTLFSKDRNPNVIIEPPPPPPAPKPEEPPPPRPEYHGQMEMGDPVAFLSLEKGGQKGFRAGDKVGVFKLVAFDHDTITLEWKDKKLTYPLEELKPKESATQPAVYASAPAQASSTSTSLIVGANPSKDPVFGVESGGVRGCAPGDNSPAGTVKDGFKKTITPGLFVPQCLWEPIK
jgi:hypothetical protein